MCTDMVCKLCNSGAGLASEDEDFHTLLAYSQPFHLPSLQKTSCHCKSCSIRMDLCCISIIVE